MNRFAVIGYPVKHSVSPAMHNAAFKALDVEAEYVRVEVAPDDLAAFISELRAGDWMGINVTVPHKENVIPLLDRLSPEAAAIGAVNTVVREESELIGHNTDAWGFLHALRNNGGFDPSGKIIAVVGAGGAARAVVWSLFEARARRVRLVNRGLSRAEKLAVDAANWGDWTEIEVLPRPDDLPGWEDALEDCQAVVNATAVGLTQGELSLPSSAVPDDALVVDLIYNPRPTRLVLESSARGLRTLDGLPMLVYQGTAAFELWSGLDAPTATMFAAAEAAIGGGPPSEPGLGIALLASGAAPRRPRRVRRSLRPGKHRE